MVIAIKKTLRADEREREDIKQAREIWEEWQKTADPSRLVFLDETGIKTNMTRLYGRSLKGQRCHASAPGGRWETITFIAGLRHDRIDAPWVLDGAMNGKAFETYIKHELSPTLKPGDIVICDNLGAHKNVKARKIIEEKGAQIMFLPAYSPDFNPIEQVFSKLKALLRKAAERSYECLWKTIGKLLKLFPKQECSNYFKNSGYDPD